MGRGAAGTVLAPLMASGTPPLGALYTLDASWPSELPALASAFSAVAVDDAPQGKEIYVIQRGPNYSDPVLVFNEAGKLLRSWGKATISFVNNTWGSHALNIQRAAAGDKRRRSHLSRRLRRQRTCHVH